MAYFFGKDRRGFDIVFPQERFDHAIERGHLDRVKGTWQTVMDAFKSSPLVLDNEPLKDRHADAPQRTGHERYVSEFLPPLGGHLVVPVIVQTTNFRLPTGLTLSPPVRIAWTAYVKDKIPDGKEIWRCPPDPES